MGFHAHILSSYSDVVSLEFVQVVSKLSACRCEFMFNFPDMFRNHCFFDHLLFLKIFYSTFPGPGEGQIIDLGVNIQQSLVCCTLINCRSLHLSTTT